MTEEAWLACDVPQTMLKFLHKRTSERKLRLFAAACWNCRCRDMTSFDQVRRVIRQAEQMADGEYQVEKGYNGWILLRADIYDMALSTVHTVGNIRGKGKVPPAEQIALLRDVFGNPFRAVALNPAWLTSDVLALARGIYGEKAFDRMPILADALQDAGCDNDDVLTHCRDAALVHVRGCWVVDLVLGKS
jgi:hypothetical protein